MGRGEPEAVSSSFQHCRPLLAPSSPEVSGPSQPQGMTQEEAAFALETGWGSSALIWGGPPMELFLFLFS